MWYIIISKKQAWQAFERGGDNGNSWNCYGK